MKKGLIALVLSAFISNVYAVKVDREQLDELGDIHLDEETHYLCYKEITPILENLFDNNREYYQIVPSDDALRQFSLRDRLKEVEKFEYMKKSDALMNAIKKDFESLQQKLYTFRTKLIEDGCVKEDKCKFKDYDLVSCEMKKPLDEILNNLDKYYTDIK